jgi:hypothetical protein
MLSSSIYTSIILFSSSNPTERSRKSNRKNRAEAEENQRYGKLSWHLSLDIPIFSHLSAYSTLASLIQPSLTSFMWSFF